MASAVVLSDGEPVEGVADSKRLAPAEREECYRRIVEWAEVVGTGAASAGEIDRRNILNATALAMKRALARVPVGQPRHVVVDGLPMKRLRLPHDAVVKGDALVHSISCASVVAKVTRDRLMRRLARRYPGYGWSRNMGYGTQEHRAALLELGPTPHHRRSFLRNQLRLKV